MAESTAMSVTLPQVLVEDIIKAEIVRHLGKRDELIGGLLASVMGTSCQCDKHRYSHNNPKKTVFACELEKQIEQACKDIVGEWIRENRDKFKAELTRRLSKPDQLRAMVSSFAEGINTGSWNVQVQLREKRD
jgi:hypothetical protein